VKALGRKKSWCLGEAWDLIQVKFCSMQVEMRQQREKRDLRISAELQFSLYTYDK